MNLFTKTLTAAAAALTLAVAFVPAAEARGFHGGHGGHGFHGGHHGHGGFGHGRHFGHRFHGHRRWAGIGVIGVGYGGCYLARKRVYDPYTGNVMIVRRTVCG